MFYKCCHVSSSWLSLVDIAWVIMPLSRYVFFGIIFHPSWLSLVNIAQWLCPCQCRCYDVLPKNSLGVYRRNYQGISSTIRYVFGVMSTNCKYASSMKPFGLIDIAEIFNIRAGTMVLWNLDPWLPIIDTVQLLDILLIFQYASEKIFWYVSRNY